MIIVPILTLLSIIKVSSSGSLLELRFVCETYRECIDEKYQLIRICGGGEKKLNGKCAETMKNDLDNMRKYEEIIESEAKVCIQKTLRESNFTYITSVDKNRFCTGYVYNTSSTDGDCSIRIARLSNRCDALRRCCEPALRCEQSAMYSENGRTLSGLREETNIKMAECAQNEEEKKPNVKVVTSAKKQRVRIIESPPFSLCLKYLQCQKDAHKMRSKCSKLSNPHSFDGLDSEDVSDATWKTCRDGLLDDFHTMNKRREEAFEYLDKCVPVANVTREFLITDRVCKASALKERKPRNELNCHLEMTRKRKECSLLRDCCVQADVCERSALYAVISDEYLLRRTQLRETFDNCMNREIEENNSVQ